MPQQWKIILQQEHYGIVLPLLSLAYHLVNLNGNYKISNNPITL